MGWTVEASVDTSAATAWPAAGISFEWKTGSAMGFYSDLSEGPVTVGNEQTTQAFLQSTVDPTVTRYLNHCRYIADTTYGVDSASNLGETGLVRVLGSEYTTPNPSVGMKFGFTTAGSVTVTQASAWYGVLDDSDNVIGTSADAGFLCRIAELTTSNGWEYYPISVNKMSINTNNSYRQELAAGTDHQWFIALSLNPKSAGAKQGAVAMDITYS